MHSTSHTGRPPFEDDCTEEMVSAQLRKMLQSSVFGRSRRLRRFLRFSVEQTLLQQTENLKEYSIGLEVFEKPETFDPRMDSIVRVVARRLRMLVERYYETEGSHDPVAIGFQSGSYVPYFRLRAGADALPRPAKHVEPADAKEPPLIIVAAESDPGSPVTADELADKLGIPIMPLTQEGGEEILRRVLSGQANVYALQVTSAAAGVLGMPVIAETVAREEESAPKSGEDSTSEQSQAKSA